MIAGDKPFNSDKARCGEPARRVLQAEKCVLNAGYRNVV
jgi:hypothetical protein